MAFKFRPLLGPVLAVLLAPSCVIATAQTIATPASTERLILEVSGGYDTSLGDTRHYEASGWNFRFGGGYRIRHRLEAVLAYGYDRSAIPQPLVTQYAFLWFYGPPPASGYPAGLPVPSSTGSVHVWSVTAEPRFQFYRSERSHAYVMAGGGFYRKMTTFNGAPGYECQSTQSAYCPFSDSTTVRHSNNAGGVQFGAGLERTISYFNRHTLFVEARYVWVDNQPSPQNTMYPPANYRTGYVPITGGVRW